MNDRESRDPERDALELLPWYVNGTLGADEREKVRGQVMASLTCRKEFERLRRLQELIRHDDPVAIATDRAFESLMSRIRATEAAASTGGQSPAFVRFAMAATVAAAAVGLAWWWAAAPVTSSAPYETLSTTRAPDSAVRLRVVFEPHVCEPERQALLASLGLTPVAPPSAEGVYTLAFPERADRNSIVEALRGDSRVRLVTSPAPVGAP